MTFITDCMEKLTKLARLIRTLENAGIYEFRIDTFGDRLKLQKIVYIAKYFGIDIGYSFNEYLRGPYSPELADDYYRLSELWDTDTIKSLEPINDENARKLIDFIKGRSTSELEGIATGLMFLRILKIRGIDDKEELRDLLVDIVKSRKPFLSDMAEQIVDTVLSTFN